MLYFLNKIVNILIDNVIMSKDAAKGPVILASINEQSILLIFNSVTVFYEYFQYCLTDYKFNFVETKLITVYYFKYTIYCMFRIMNKSMDYAISHFIASCYSNIPSAVHMTTMTVMVVAKESLLT